MIRHSLIVLAALPFLLVACDGGGDPVEQAVREAATVNQAATVTAGEVSGPRSRDHGTAGNQAFAASEAEMHRLMAAASGETVDQAYIA